MQLHNLKNCSANIQEINYIKMNAILFVITLHSVPKNILFETYSSFHIWQAVPIFMVLAGLTSTLHATGKVTIRKEFSVEKLKKYINKIIIPVGIIGLLELIILACSSGITLNSVIKIFIKGGYGPGSYFTPLFVQHILLFPFILILKQRLKDANYIFSFIVFIFISLLMEYLCIIMNIDVNLYRLLYVRYVYAAVLGSYLLTHGINLAFLVIMASLSIVYIYGVTYTNMTFPFIYPAWYFQHAPSYFYTTIIVVLLWKTYPFFGKLFSRILIIGKASYHIFLIQMVYFWRFAEYINESVDNIFLYVVINIFLCAFIGVIFYRFQPHYKFTKI